MLCVYLPLGGDEKKPEFMAFVDELPGFLRPFAPTKFPATPFPVEVSIEEAIERARSLFLEGMSCVQGVYIRSQARDVHYETEYRKAGTALGLAKKHGQAMDERNKSLLKEMTELRQSNQVSLR